MHKKESTISIDTFIGRKIRDRRTRLRWTLQELGIKLGISYQQLQKYEQGTSRISSALLYDLSNIFCVNVNYFFDRYYQLDKTYKAPSLLTPKKSPLSILLIEPDATDELWTRRAFKSCKSASNLFFVKDGRSALGFMRAKDFSQFMRPDIILMELNLPQENGMQIMRDLRQDTSSFDIPLIILTHSILRQQMEEAYKRHACGFITKSSDFDVYKKQIRTLVAYWSQTAILP